MKQLMLILLQTEVFMWGIMKSLALSSFRLKRIDEKKR